MSIFQALSEPRREAILRAIASNGKMNAGEICALFDISAPAVSQHLKVLRVAGLVNVEIQAQKRIYSLEKSGIGEIEKWLNEFREQMEAQTDRLQAFLESGQDIDA